MTQRVAFVAGATGYTGLALVPALLSQGVRVVAHVRPESPRLAELTQHFTHMGAAVDATPWPAIVDAVTKHRPSLVFSLLGTTRARGKRAKAEGRTEDYETVDYGLTMDLLRACQAQTPPPLFVYLSSVGADGAGGNAYLHVRKRVEAALADSGLPHIVVRPSLITGANREDDRPGERFAAAVLRGVLPVAKMLGGGAFAEKYRAMTNEELATHMVRHALGPYHGPKTLEPAALRAEVE